MHNGGRIYDTFETINERGLANSSARVLAENTVCLSRTASVGYVVTMGRPMATSQDFINWVCTDGLDPDFLKYLFIAEGRNLLRFASGAVHQTIYFPEAKAFYICHPVLREQRRIVAALDEICTNINAGVFGAVENIRNSQAIFSGRLEEVFTNVTPGMKGVGLKDICQIASVLIDPREMRHLDLPHVGAGNIESKTGNLLKIKTAREEGLVSGKFVFDESMILYSKIRPYLMKVARPAFSGICSADVYPLKPVDGLVSRDYLFYLLLSRSFTNYAIQGSARVGMPKVNRQHLFEYRVRLPKVTAQMKLASALDELHESTRHLESLYRRKLNALEELKRSLLHRAFTGQLRGR
jgi:type I restriction enzyme S subunit